ncbi:MAG: hypothetical protein AAF541_05960 [Pseudomonadota bacterium]
MIALPSLSKLLAPRLPALAGLLLLSNPGFALEADFRIKWFTTASQIPPHDVERAHPSVAAPLIGRSGEGTPTLDHSLDLRLILKQDIGPFRLLLDHSTIVLNGDAIVAGGGLDTRVDQTVSEDGRRFADLTRPIDDGSRWRSFHRLDRLAVQYQKGNWGVTLGRQAVSWGSGIVFQPLDLFSPFSPTVVDRDYKAGDDLILVEHLLDNGHDLQLLHVVRRDDTEEVTQQVASSALKWHGYVGAGEFEVIAAQHYDDTVAGFSLRWPLGQALVRADLVISEDLSGDRVYSGLLNADVTFTLGGRNAYVFAEFFHNGWGVSRLPDNPVFLPEELNQRLIRGEVFNLMRNYVAFGGNYEWHPLISQNLTMLTNLHDGSSLLQMQVSYSPGDNQNMDLGFILPLGSRGDEFGGIPLAGSSVTTGGASRGYFRWVYFL